MHDKQQLHGQLRKLHAELQQVESLIITEREMLDNLTKEVREILERESNYPHHYRGLGERLRDAVAQFEASHPNLTNSMRDVIEQLAFMGI
jgi:hypothetical protein